METWGQINSLPDLAEEGFLSENSHWSQKVAEELARINEIWPLSLDHWKVINYVRDYYAKNGEGPLIYKISRAIGLSGKYICELFPCGIVKGAYRIAGLPRPPGCL
jgi:tRNA 2-thiouridine synthesizing protein E